MSAHNRDRKQLLNPSHVCSVCRTLANRRRHRKDCKKSRQKANLCRSSRQT